MMFWSENNSKRISERAVFKLIRRSQGSTKQRVADQLRATFATVAACFNNLLEAGLIKETGIEDSAAGRKSVIYNVNPDGMAAVGAHLEHGRLLTGLVNAGGTVLHAAEHEVGARATPESIAELLLEFKKSAIERSSFPEERIVAGGVALTGPINRETGAIPAPVSHFPETWNERPLPPVFQGKLGIPFVVDSIGQAGAMAEYLFGLDDPTSDLVFVHVGRYGIGTGIITKDEIYTGVENVPGSLGHMSVLLDHTDVTKKTYLEEVTTANAVLSDVRRRASLRGVSNLAALDTYSKIAERAEAGDELCRGVILERSAIFGIYLANFMNVIRPQCIVIGGETINMSPLYRENARKLCFLHYYSVLSQTAPDVRNTSFGDKQYLIGAAALALWQVTI